MPAIFLGEPPHAVPHQVTQEVKEAFDKLSLELGNAMMRNRSLNRENKELRAEVFNLRNKGVV